MSVAIVEVVPTVRTGPRRRRHRGSVARLVFLTIFTLTALIPIWTTVGLAFRFEPSISDASDGLFANFTYIFSETSTIRWLTNSIVTALASVIVSVVIGAPAAYVLSRRRGFLVSGYGLLLFIMQSVPVIILVIPLFLLFAPLHLVDSLMGITIVYVASTLAVTTWMMSAYFDTIPISLEEAAWIDGCSMFGSFVRIVLRNSLPGVLSSAIFAFLVAWNDYLIAIVFLRSDSTLTLQVGMQSFFQQNQTIWGPVMAISVLMLIPPVIVFTALNKYFSVGGIGGSLAGT